MLFRSGGFDGLTNEGGIFSFSITHGNYTQIGNLPTPVNSNAIAWDSSTQLAYTFGGWATVALDHVLRIHPNTGQVFQVATLPQGITRAAAAWTRNGLGYVFGGVDTDEVASSDILEFNPLQGTVTKLNAALPYNLVYACAVSTNEVVYVLGGAVTGSRLVQFDLEIGRASCRERV